MKKRYLIVILIILFLILSGFFIYKYIDKQRLSLSPELVKGFEVDTLFLKVAVSEGDKITSNIKITNRDGNDNFFVYIKGLENIVTLSEDNFMLNPGETKNVEIIFNIKNKDYGVYLGNLEISSESEIKKIPVILEIQSKNVLFDSNIDLLSKEGNFYPGDKISSEIKIFDLANVGRSNLKLDYFIKDFDDRIIISESETVVVDGKRDHSKTFNLPDDIRLGEYALIVVLSYGDIVSTSSTLLEIVDKNENTNSVSANNLIDESNFSIVVILIVIFFLAFSFLMVYSLFYRDKLLKELQNQYKRELIRERELIKLKSKKDYPKLNTHAERREYYRELRTVKINRIRGLREMYKNRLNEFRKIKMKGDNNKLVKLMKNWKSKGYNTAVLERKFRTPDVNEIKRKVSNWKSKGYDTSILDRKLKK